MLLYGLVRRLMLVNYHLVRFDLLLFCLKIILCFLIPNCPLVLNTNKKALSNTLGIYLDILIHIKPNIK